MKEGGREQCSSSFLSGAFESEGAWSLRSCIYGKWEVSAPTPPGFDTPVSVSSMVTLSASCTFQSRGQETDVELSFSRFLHQSSNFVSLPIQKRTLRLLSRGCSRRNWLLNFP